MVKNLLLVFLFMVCSGANSQQAIPTDIQVKTAVLALPEAERENAAVYGYRADGSLLLLREGSGNMICIADNPAKKGISVSCYPKSLEAFMARGRELNARGKSFEEKMKIRGEEIKSGKLRMPDAPTMLTVFFGKEENYDPATGELSQAKYRYVIYTPFATAMSTGLPDTPQPGGKPWLMDAGTHRAHIMIGPFE